MPKDDSLRKHPMHALHQLPQGPHLLRRPGISSNTSCIQPTLIADANRMAVMPHDMGAHHFETSSSEDLPLSVHPEMVADTLPALRPVVVIDFLDRIVLIRSETVSMQHDHRNLPHITA